MVGGAFFMVYFYGWAMWLDCRKVGKMFPHLDNHTVGYLVIATVYLIFAFKH